MLSDLDVHFEFILLYLYPLRNNMDPVFTVSGLDLDCLPMLIIIVLSVYQLADMIILT